MERIDILKAAFGANAEKFEENLVADTRAQFDAYVHKVSLQKSVFETRSQLSQKVPEFWFNSLRNCKLTQQYLDNVDVDCLKHLKDVWIEHSEKDVRDYEITFTFSNKNPYFKEPKISKKVTVTPPKGSEHESLLPSPYDLDAPLFLLPSKLPWTSDEHNLVKKAPKVNVLEMEEFDEDFSGSAGSFFNWFETEGEDDMGLGETLLEWWSHATEYAAGLSSMDSDDGEDFSGGEFDDEESDDEDPKKEIDLSDEDSKRPKKKQKK
ncbi:Vps75p [Sporobolomyces salmoneus]|uniref:Vps75p n=1 Tax=Sporobolomyces salmoneus TaxID=183962 RepID=UPI003172B40F